MQAVKNSLPASYSSLGPGRSTANAVDPHRLLAAIV